MSVTLAVDKEERTGGQSEVMYFIFADGTFVCAYTEANTAINRAEDWLSELCDQQGEAFNSIDRAI